MSGYNTLLKNASGYAQAFQATDTTTEQMRAAIGLWFEMYYRDEADEHTDPSMQLPYTIVQKLTKTAFSEYTTTAKDTFSEGILKALAEKRAEAMQLTLIGGEAMLKPIPDVTGKGFYFAVVPRYNMLIFARDARGNPTDVGTMEVSTAGNCYYTLLERRTVDAGGYLTIRYRLFKSYAKDNLGQEVPLSSLPQYEQLQPEYTFTRPVGSVGMVRMKTPMVNCVDGSVDGVSVYAAAVGLIRNINRNEAQLNGEFERGESRIIVSDDMLMLDKDGNKGLRDNVFVGLDDDQESVGVTIFSPALREASFLTRKQEYLRAVESVIGLKRGLLSDAETVEKTATEITSSSGEYNLMIIDLQKMWEKTVRETVRVCGILGQLYKLAGAHEVAEDAVEIDFGNGILYDEEKTRTEMLAQVQAGLLQAERYIGHCYNLPCETETQRAKIRKDYMPQTENLIDE